MAVCAACARSRLASSFSTSAGVARSPRALNACEQVAFEILFVVYESLEVGIVGIRLRHQIEQVERSAGCGCQIGGDRRDDASGCARDQKDAVLVEYHAGLAIGGGLFLEADAPTLFAGVSDLDSPRIMQSSLRSTDRRPQPRCGSLQSRLP